MRDEFFISIDVLHQRHRYIGSSIESLNECRNAYYSPNAGTFSGGCKMLKNSLKVDVRMSFKPSSPKVRKELTVQIVWEE